MVARSLCSSGVAAVTVTVSVTAPTFMVTSRRRLSEVFT